MKKSSLGFLLWFFFGIFGLLGLLACAGKEDKDEFMSGWWKAFILEIVIAVIIILAVTCGTCALLSMY